MKHYNVNLNKQVFFTRHFTNAQIDISNAQIFFYECAEKRLSNACLNCAEINCFYRYKSKL